MIDLVVAIWVYFIAGVVLVVGTVGFLGWLFNAMQDEYTNKMNDDENTTRPRIYRDDR